MAEIAITRRFDSESRRCPWCHEGDAAGDDWLSCPRDQTPIHASCLKEYGNCPICREAVVPLQERIAVRPRVPPLSVERLVAPELGEERRAFLNQVRGSYVPGWLDPLCVLIALIGLPFLLTRTTGAFGFSALCGYAGVLALLRGLFKRPRHSRWQKARASEETRSLSRRIVDNDRLALRRAERIEEIARAIAKANQKLAALEYRDQAARRRAAGRLRNLRRAEHRRATPIDDARRIRGIGPGIVWTLQLAGIASLDDLLQSRPENIRGIGPHRAALLRSWAENRERAIERLIASEPEPETPGLPRLAEEAAAIVEEYKGSLGRADELTAAIDQWRDEREKLVALVSAMQTSQD